MNLKIRMKDVGSSLNNKFLLLDLKKFWRIGLWTMCLMGYYLLAQKYVRCDSDNKNISSVFELNCGDGKQKNQTLEELAQEIVENLEAGHLAIVVDKSNFSLCVYKNLNGKRIKIKEFPIAIGKGGKGNKEKVGDKKTPEGVFKISEMSIVDENYMGKYKTNILVEILHKLFGLPRSPFGTRWIGLEAIPDYKGFITPEWRGIGIHGVIIPPDLLPPLTRYQTDGCVGLSIKNVQELYEMISPKYRNRQDVYVVIKP